MGEKHSDSDFGTLETQLQSGGISKGYTADGQRVGKVRYQSPIDILYHRDRIDDKQWAAAERLRQDAQNSGKFSYVKSSADFSVKGNRKDEPAEWMIRAGNKYKVALSTLTNEEKSLVIFVVIEEGFIKWLTDVKLKIVAMDILRRALNILVKYYRI